MSVVYREPKFEYEPVKPVRIVARCQNLIDGVRCFGYLHYIGPAMMGMGCTHLCSTCRSEDELPRRYPYIEYDRIEGE